MAGDDATTNREPGDSSLGHDILAAQLRHTVLGGDEALNFGRFELLRRLGAGAMGVVFEAHDPELDRRVALKLLHRHLSGFGEARVRMRREGQVLARLQHPNIVQVFESGEHEGTPFVAMELVSGVTLTSWLSTPRTPTAVLSAMVQAGTALAEAHRHGIVHRDFKPENVLIDDRGRVRVVDFGVAGLVDRVDDSESARGMARVFEGSGLTTRGAIGTPRYMAPEQRDGAAAAAHSDQYSYCLVTYEALFGAESSTDLRRAGAQSVRLRSGRAIARILRRGLERDPACRWPDMDALLRAIARVRRRRPLVAIATGVVLAATATGGGAVVHAQRCAWRADDARAAWIDRDAPGVRAGLAAAEVPYADEVAALAVERLGTHVDELAAANQAYCRGHFDPFGPPTSIEVCLDAQHAGVAGLIGRLREADAAVAETALFALDQLPSPQACEADAVHDHDIVLDAAFERGFSELVIACRFARVADCRDGATLLAEQSAQAGRRRDEARALIQRSGAYRDLEAFDAARADLLAAFYELVDLGDPLAAVAAAQLVVHFGVVTRDAQWVEHWVKMVELFDREGRMPIEQWAEVAQARAAVASTLDQEREILAQIEALETRVEEGRRGTRAHLYASRGYLLDRMGRVAEAADDLTRARAQLLALLGAAHPRVADLDVNLASVLRKLGRLDEAATMARESIAIYTAALPAGHLDLARAHLNFAAVLADQGETAASVREHELVVDMLAERGDDEVLAQAHLNLAILAAQIGRKRDAFTNVDLAIAMRQRLVGSGHVATLDALTAGIEIHGNGGDDAGVLALIPAYLAAVAGVGPKAPADAAQWGWRQAAETHHRLGGHAAEVDALDQAIAAAEQRATPGGAELEELRTMRAACTGAAAR